jgi:hypothetical protein
LHEQQYQDEQSMSELDEGQAAVLVCLFENLNPMTVAGLLEDFHLQ